MHGGATDRIWMVLPVLPVPVFAVAPNDFNGLRNKTGIQTGARPVQVGQIALQVIDYKRCYRCYRAGSTKSGKIAP